MNDVYIQCLVGLPGYVLHRPFKMRTDGSQSRVHELVSIGIFTVTLSKVEFFLPTFEHKWPQ